MRSHKKFLAIISSLLITMFSSCASGQSIRNAATDTFKVEGNCGMCEKTIETAANKKGVVKADWNKDSKLLVLTFDNKKTNSDQILKRVAYAGYDNEKYLAPNEAYAKLHECCKYERKTSKTTKTVDNKQHSEQPEDQKKEIQLDRVYSLYFEMKNALVSDDAGKAASKSKELFDAFNAVKMETLDTQEHDAFMKDLSDMKGNTESISKTKDIEQQRKHFSKLSGNMYELMKVIKPSYPVYLENCPMYNDGNGANWISKESVIKNPYYGSKMLTCGNVKETLK